MWFQTILLVVIVHLSEGGYELVGGKNCSCGDLQDDYPWLAEVITDRHRILNHVCGGTVIHQHYVLTTAGCAKRLTLGIGAVVVRARPLAGSLVANVTKITIQPRYNEIVEANDIAILKIAKAGSILNLYSICMPPKGLRLEGYEKLTVVGLIRRKTGKGRLYNKGHEEMTVISSNTCVQSNMKSTLCAWGPKEGNIFQRVDLGVPAALKSGSSYLLAGVLNRIGGDRPWTFTMVSYYLDWITQNTVGSTLCATKFTREPYTIVEIPPPRQGRDSYQ